MKQNGCHQKTEKHIDLGCIHIFLLLGQVSMNSKRSTDAVIDSFTLVLCHCAEILFFTFLTSSKSGIFNATHKLLIRFLKILKFNAVVCLICMLKFDKNIQNEFPHSSAFLCLQHHNCDKCVQVCHLLCKWG